jgi:hypothetical protein
MKASGLSAQYFAPRLDNRPLRPSHICLLLTLLFFIAPAIQQGHASGLQTKTAILINADLRYRLLVENAQVRVFALSLPPGAQSFVRQEHNYLTVQIVENAQVRVFALSLPRARRASCGKSITT